MAFSRSDDGWPHRQPADARVSGRPPPALNDHQARGHHDERDQRGQDHDQHEGHGHLRPLPRRMNGRWCEPDRAGASPISHADAIHARVWHGCRTRHGLRFRPRAAVSALASGRRGPTQGEGQYHPTLGDAPAAPALIAWGKGILLLTLADHEMARRI